MIKYDVNKVDKCLDKLDVIFHLEPSLEMMIALICLGVAGVEDENVDILDALELVRETVLRTYKVANAPTT